MKLSIFHLTNPLFVVGALDLVSTKKNSSKVLRVENNPCRFFLVRELVVFTTKKRNAICIPTKLKLKKTNI